jgi:tripartite-type tricarboxylate transporter receptor subunit TctC
MRRRFLLGLMGSVPARGGAAMDWRPTRAVRLIVPVAAGGSQDAVARLLARPLTGSLGQPLVVENLPGAAGNLGFQAVARARPDGYTLLAGSDGLSINKTLFPRLDFDPVEAFVAVSWVVRVPQLLVARPDFGEGLDGFLRRVRQGPVSVGTTGVGSLAHLLGEEMQAAAGARWVHVPYRGGAPAVTDLLAGTLDAALVNIGAAAAQVNAGTLRGLCVSSAERVPALPGVPSILESGLLREAVVGWHGIVAPRDTPVPVLETIDAAVQAALPELAPRLRVLGVEPVREAPARLQALIRTDAARWGALIRQAGITPA